jgi:hypothetical protein
MWTLTDKAIDTYLSSSGKIYPHYLEGAEYTQHSIDTGHVFRRDIPKKRYEAYIKFRNTQNSIMYYVQDYKKVSQGIVSWLESGSEAIRVATRGVTYVCQRTRVNERGFFIGCLNLGLNDRFQWKCYFSINSDGKAVYEPSLGGGYSQTEVKDALFALFKPLSKDKRISTDELKVVKLE